MPGTARDAAWAELLQPGHQGWLWVVAGSLTVDGGTVPAGHAMALPHDARITAGAQGARLFLFSGVPTQSTVVQGGPFVGSSRPQIDAFQNRYRSGGMGQLAPFDQAEIDRDHDAQQKVAQQNIA